MDMNPITILRISILVAALASLALSVLLYFSNDASEVDKLNGIYVGTWVPSILALGCFLVLTQKKGDR